MRIGMIGLGRMGGAMARRLMRAGHRCVVYDAIRQAARRARRRTARRTPPRWRDLVQKLADRPRAVWVMLPAGAITEDDGARARRAARAGRHRHRRRQHLLQGRHPPRQERCAENDIHYVDCGTSGGVWGFERGYCMMIGGPKDAVDHLDPIFAALAPGARRHPAHARPRESRPTRRARLHSRRPAGAGHFVKMIHNGIEYGLMQAYAEGFEILASRDAEDLPEDERFDLEPARHRRSLAARQRDLLLAARPLRRRAGRGRSAERFFRPRRRIPARAAGPSRRRSRKPCPPTCSPPRSTPGSARASRHSFGEKLLSAMRFGFGGHVEAAAGVNHVK